MYPRSYLPSSTTPSQLNALRILLDHYFHPHRPPAPPPLSKTMVPLSLATSLSTPLATSFAGAQALWWPCGSRRAPRIFLLFIPGNPGLASYYTPFLSTIYNHPALRSRIEILAVSHRGHAPLPPGDHPVWGDNEESMRDARKGYGATLKDQIRHKIAAVDAVRKCYPVRGGEAGEGGEAKAEAEGEETQLVVCGHSVGAYIAVEVLKARPDAVDGLHLLFPTLSWIANTPNARRLKPLFHPLVYTLLLPLPLFLLSLIPMIFFLPLVRLVTAQPRPAVTSTIDLLRMSGAVRNAIRMAAEEMTTIKHLQTDVKEAIAKLAEKRQEGRKGGAIRTYWSRGDEDGWAPGWLRRQVEAELQLHRIHLPAGFGTRAPRGNTINGTTEPLVASPISEAPPPSAPKLLRKRTRSFSLSEYRSASASSMPNLKNARAKRKATGEIVIETTLEGDSSGDDDHVGGAAGSSRANGHSNEASWANKRATSTVCKIGMPHAFCLKHGEEMGEIAAHWLQLDHL
ncbi:hypothetical protein ACQY0O_003516 [Thecaphora frezii]